MAHPDASRTPQDSTGTPANTPAGSLGDDASPTSRRAWFPPRLMTSRSRRKRPCTQGAASVRSLARRDGPPAGDPLPREEFVAALTAQGARYWDKHPFHVRLHEGGCTQGEVRAWVANRWYYQRNLSQKNGAIIANCPLPEVRRRWVERITFQDGTPDGARRAGGLARAGRGRGTGPAGGARGMARGCGSPVRRRFLRAFLPDAALDRGGGRGPDRVVLART